MRCGLANFLSPSCPGPLIHEPPPALNFENFQFLPPAPTSKFDIVVRPRLPAAIEAGDEDPQLESEFEEEEECSEAEFSPGLFEYIFSALTVFVQTCLAPLSRGSGEEPAGRKRKAAAQPEAAAAAGGGCRHCTKCSGRREWKPHVRVKSSGCVVRLRCGGCNSFAALPKGEISVGDAIEFEGHLWLVRSLRSRKHHGGEDSWHVQELSKQLELPPEGSEPYEIIGNAALWLERRHGNIPLQAFAAAWGRGEADMLGPRQLFYTSCDGCYDQLAVPAQCPGFDCCDCECKKPWAVRGGGGCEVYHLECKAPQLAGRPPELLDPAGRPAQHVPPAGCLCRFKGTIYSPGDLAWLLPPGSPDVDAQLELVRIERFFLPIIDYESQDAEAEGLPNEVWRAVAVEYKLYSRTDSMRGFEYQPTEEKKVWKADQLHGLYEGGRRAPGSWVAGSASTTGSSAHAAGACCGSAGIPGSLHAVAGSGKGERGAAACDVTPTASDSTAHVSWHSSGSDASSGHACSDASSAHEPGSSSPTDARAGSSWDNVVVGSTFCGCGGLDIGLRQGLPGAQAKWACDLYPAALQTYAEHSPGTRMHAEDVCSFLRAIRSGNKDYPSIGCPPKKWRIFVGGPPCQGFSRANTNGNEQEKAKKNILVGAFLSVLQELQWPYAIMENVVGLLAAGDLMQRIMQWAVSAGYQVSFRVLNTGSYGVPQHRRRVIVFFAQAHLPMPFHPEPTHVFRGAGGYQGGSGSCTYTDREKAARRGVPTIWHQNVIVPRHAPLPAITVNDAIGDLPLESGATAYTSPPHSHYAACMRGGGAAAVGAPLHNHETCQVDSETLRRVAHIPKEGHQPRPRGASSVPHPFFPIRSGNWLDLPPELRTPAMNAAREGVARCSGMFARLQWGSHFATVLTNPALNSHSTSTFIHPEADRPLTQREAARAQGFPDSVCFQGTPADGYKQIGNAVPPPLATALGRELARAMRLAEQQQ